VYDAGAVKAEIIEFYRVLFDLFPQSIGGRLPDDALFLDL
jgi:hypothetical protein